MNSEAEFQSLIARELARAEDPEAFIRAYGPGASANRFGHTRPRSLPMARPARNRFLLYHFLHFSV